ncbi:unnamed protein product [Linum tenue]|uniref:Disease resistance R13L4/SHOC-2-like LRR domain-containing protein n=1 Tax=Linum tenue TaxID=586396 RepID=A0AAV0RPW8_9ROSI|nr:unnamed protein product [Linum tenue]
MENLRLLVIRHTTACSFILPEDGLRCLPDTLRVLDWDHFGTECLPPRFSCENLVILRLYSSKLERLWDDEANVELGNLKSLGLSRSECLRKLPNLSTALRLEEIYLEYCVSLVELPTSILDLPKLKTLDVSFCRSLDLNNLEYYADDGGEQSGQHDQVIFPSLKKLIVSWTPIQNIPNFITRSHILKLDCGSCKLDKFPVIPSLESLKAGSCGFEEVIELGKLTKLKRLDLSYNYHLIHLSAEFYKLEALEEIDLSYCDSLEEFPEILEAMEAVEVLNLSGCNSLSNLPNSIANLVHLGSLDLSYTDIRELPLSIVDLTQLTILRLNNCLCLTSLPDTMNQLYCLRTLELIRCYELNHLPELPPMLYKLTAQGCLSLQSFSFENQDLMIVEWNFGDCLDLDGEVCSKLVDKFIQASTRSANGAKLILPPTMDSSSGDGEGNLVTTELRGQPWELKLKLQRRFGDLGQKRGRRLLD